MCRAFLGFDRSLVWLLRGEYNKRARDDNGQQRTNVRGKGAREGIKIRDGTLGYYELSLLLSQESRPELLIALMPTALEHAQSHCRRVILACLGSSSGLSLRCYLMPTQTTIGCLGLESSLRR